MDTGRASDLFNEVAEARERGVAHTEAGRHVAAYFLGVKGKRAYAGAAFETIGHPWRVPATVDAITPADLLALGCLSSPVKKYTAAHLLDDSFQAQASALLAQIPADASIADPGAAAALADKSPASQLYSLIRGIGGMGKVRTSKLMARKRPGLIPIRDANVEEILDATADETWWLPYHAMVTEGEAPFIKQARRIHAALKLSALITPLRVVDVVLWRTIEQKHRGSSDTEDKPE